MDFLLQIWVHHSEGGSDMFELLNLLGNLDQREVTLHMERYVPKALTCY